jgi:hypothetical protein
MSEKKDKKEDGSISDMIKKIASIGLGGAFLTEEAIRNLLGDVPLPKDIVSGLVQNAKGAKEDFAKSLREEFRKYLSHVDTKKLTDYVLQNYDVEVKASFSFKKKDGTSEDKE